MCDSHTLTSRPADKERMVPKADTVERLTSLQKQRIKQINLSGHHGVTSFFQSFSVCGWTSAFLLIVHGLCDVIERRFSATLAQDGLAECHQPQGKIL